MYKVIKGVLLFFILVMLSYLQLSSIGIFCILLKGFGNNCHKNGIGSQKQMILSTAVSCPFYLRLPLTAVPHVM